MTLPLRFMASLVSVIAIPLLFGVGAASGASFSCKRASTPDERAICASETLSQQDIQVDRTYRLAVGKFGKSIVADAARGFLNERRSCRTNHRCISDVQNRMIDHYNDLLTKPGNGSTVGSVVPYGSRAGMETTVVNAYGLGTAKAMIETEHTRENAKAFCREYVQTASEKCIQETLRDVEPKGTLIADCTSGEFSSFSGEALTRRGDGTIFNRDTNEVLDGSMAIGEPVYSAQYEKLCPTE